MKSLLSHGGIGMDDVVRGGHRGELHALCLGGVTNLLRNPVRNFRRKTRHARGEQVEMHVFEVVLCGAGEHFIG